MSRSRRAKLAARIPVSILPTIHEDKIAHSNASNNGNGSWLGGPKHNYYWTNRLRRRQYNNHDRSNNGNNSQRPMSAKSYFLILVVFFAGTIFFRPYYSATYSKSLSSSQMKLKQQKQKQKQRQKNLPQLFDLGNTTTSLVTSTNNIHENHQFNITALEWIFSTNPKTNETTTETRTSLSASTSSSTFLPKSLSSSSNAPLFYHISPGSTGSRTLYHAACQAGFPSVHHKSFCISSTRGIGGVDADVVEGVRAHFEVLRWYQIADECCSLWTKGKLDGTIISPLEESVGTVRTGGKGNKLDKRGTNGQKETTDESNNEIPSLPCHMPLQEWSNILQRHLQKVISSGIVGLFDTPYPYLAPQILALAKKERISPPIIAMTERDPKGWANSRSRNHGLMVCRKEYSYEEWGGSEFDVLGCVDRAYYYLKRNENSTNDDDNTDSKDELDTEGDGSSSNDYDDDDDENGNTLVEANNNKTQSISSPPSQPSSSNTILHFWDVFEHRSHKDPLDDEFQKGMERQMEHHQQLYLPLANYTPDFFGVKSSQDVEMEHDNGRNEKPNTPTEKNTTTTTLSLSQVDTLPKEISRIEEEDVLTDIRKQILDPSSSLSNVMPSSQDTDAWNKKNITIDKLREVWRENYSRPLTCRGRVNWEKLSNTLVEVYHLPKTCQGTSSPSKAGKSRGKEEELVVEEAVLPLILV